MMRETWRLIEHPALPGAFNMGADYALMKAVSRGDSPPVLRLYRWIVPAVTIGYFQVIDEELDAEACASDGVPIIRRITGGGAVLHEFEITYSVCVPLAHPLAFGTVLDSYRGLLAPVIEALARVGVTAEYQPVNDIVTNGKKISGSAQTRRDGVLLQHGTLLLDLDAARMFRYLKIAPEKLAGKEPAGAASRVTSLREMIGPRAGGEAFIGEMNAAIIGSFRDKCSIEFSESVLSPAEEEDARGARERLFENPAWNRDRAVKP
ncbi:MAG: lipoate--protein ligase family protein [Spirochaetes bacterium]|nr:MAG: lipoate--protein ligase family protein [Spirochaetota bacterium]